MPLSFRRSTLSSVTPSGQYRNSKLMTAPPSAQTAIVTAASAAVAPVGRRSA